ncbi:hypothetical protein ACFDR9_002657 [Janthinobacterium sp. CG_23.3]|uniref:hypothetical protein n=1 Tax=Janthinobacterium sp. CG_23.3 TaxID=3349634 RepID=UPI0038D465F0
MSKISVLKTAQPAIAADASGAANGQGSPFPTTASIGAAADNAGAAAVVKAAPKRTAKAPLSARKAVALAGPDGAKPVAVKAKPAAAVKPVKPVAAKPAAVKAAPETAAAKATPAAAKAAVKPAAKAKAAAKPALKAPAKPAAKPAAKAGAKVDAAALAKEKARKPKLVRDSFTMPEGEYAVLSQVKKACLKAGFEIKKSELLRIGVALISQIDMATLQSVLSALPQLKTGRPKKD